MTQNIDHLIAALREELQQYGEMLARLEEQQERVLRRDADQILQSVSAIQEQGLVIQRARELREARQKETAATVGVTGEPEFAAIIRKLPSDYAGLVETLITENNSLLQRIQQRARQNHLLLRQSLDLMQRFLSTLFPTHEPRVYNPGGQVFTSRPAPAVAFYEAVG